MVQGGFNELRAGSFKQGFISGVVGKLGGGLVHNSFSDAQLVERTIGIVVVSGVAAAASGARGKDAVMKSAISVITVYLYNELGDKQYSENSQMTKNSDGNWQYRENAALKAAGLSPDTSYGCSTYDIQSCALQGTMYGKGGSEVTKALNDV